MDVVGLLQVAKEASSNSYSPYSHFPVGAALLCSSGTIYTGVNVENRSFGLTTCAERSALFAAISHGDNQFEAIAVVTPASEDPVPPCGACRQVLSEFVSKDFPIYFASRTMEYRTKTMGELLPEDSLHDLGGRA